MRHAPGACGLRLRLNAPDSRPRSVAVGLLSPQPSRHLEDVLAIYNDAIANTNAVYTETLTTLEERKAWLQARRDSDLPVLVAKYGEELVGFGSFGPFRPWPGYARTVEHSVYVRHSDRRRGTGSALVIRLIEEARRRGMRVMIGGIDGSNAASLALHRKLGFEDAGCLKEVAYKFGKPLDLILLHKRIFPSPAAR